MKLDGCNALITGASAGIGCEFARQLAGRAASLVLVARRLDRLETLRDELRQRNPNLQIQIRSVDLSDEAALAALCEWIEREKIPIDFLINNAGLGDTGPFATSEPNRVKEMILVNIFALTLLTRRLLPLIQAQKAQRDSKCQLVRGFSSDSDIGRVRGEQSLRDEFFRSVARGIAGHVGNRDGALSRTGDHRVP